MLGSYSLGARDHSRAAAGAPAARLIDQGLPLDELLGGAGGPVSQAGG
jgi:hypothetical protein